MGPAQTSPCTLRLDYWFSPDFSLLCYTAPPTPSNVFKQTAIEWGGLKWGWTGLPSKTHAQCPWEPGGCLVFVA